MGRFSQYLQDHCAALAAARKMVMVLPATKELVAPHPPERAARLAAKYERRRAETLEALHVMGYDVEAGEDPTDL